MPAVAASATDPATGTADAAAATRFRLDLARPGDFVAQANFVQCVGASMQMMLNVSGPNDRTAATQRRLQRLARNLSGPTRAGFERKGASVRGWSAGLNQLGAGPYRLVGVTHPRRGDATRGHVDPDDGQAGRAARLGRAVMPG